MQRKRFVNTALLVAALALAAGACGDDTSGVSAAGQEPGSSDSMDTTSDVPPSSEAAASTTTSDVPASSEPTSSSTSEPGAEPGGIASPTYLPEGYEPTSSEESAPGVTSKRYRYPTSETEPPRVIIVRTVLDVVPDEVPMLLEGATEEVTVGEHTGALFLAPEDIGANGMSSLRWVTADNTMYEVVVRGAIEDPAGELLRIAENLSFDQ